MKRAIRGGKSVRDAGVGGSNPLVPTNKIQVVTRYTMAAKTCFCEHVWSETRNKPLHLPFLGLSPVHPYTTLRLDGHIFKSYYGRKK